MADGGLQRDEEPSEYPSRSPAEFQLAIRAANVLAHLFSQRQWPFEVWRAPMRLKMDGDSNCRPLAFFGPIAPAAVWVDAPVKKDERLAGANAPVKIILAH